MMIMLAAGALLLLSYSVIPSFGLRFWQSRRRRKKGGEKVLYLSFDDGPSERYTGQILGLLKRYKIKAAFFVVASFAEAYPELIKRMQEDGHMIGLHSAGHQSSLLRGNKFVSSDLAQAVFAIRKLGCRAVYYRPPWGHLNLFTLLWVKKLELKLVFWDVMAEDWEERATPALIKKRLMKRVFPGAIICLHDGRGANGAPGNTYEALKGAIPELIARGYEFRRMDADG